MRGDFGGAWKGVLGTGFASQHPPKAFLDLVAVEHAFQVPALGLRSGCALRIVQLAKGSHVPAAREAVHSWR